MAHCRHLLADFKKSRFTEFASELSKNANGKLSRKKVRERYWAGQERRVASLRRPFPPLPAQAGGRGRPSALASLSMALSRMASAWPAADCSA